MPRKGWVNLNIRRELYAYIEELVEKQPQLGYSTVPDFVRAAIRHLLRHIEKGDLSAPATKEYDPAGRSDGDS